MQTLEQKKQAARERVRRWREQHPTYNADYSKQWRLDNPDKDKESQRNRIRKPLTDEQKQRYKDVQRKWNEANREKIQRRERARKRKPLTEQQKQRKREYERNRRATDPAFAMVTRLRTRLSHAVQSAKTKKAGHTVDLLGCSPAELVAWIESQFLPGMSWGNRHLWHIDHKKPCSRFDMLDPAQQKECFHYTNLQPLWSADNRAKWDR